MTPRSSRSGDLDGALRDVLAGEARAALMPDQVLQVPSAWVRSPGRGPGRLLGTVGVVGAVAAGIAIVMLAASHVERAPRQLTTGAAALLAGIPPEQMLATSDGFVGVRAPTTADPRIALVLVPSGGGPPRTLGVGTLSDFTNADGDAFQVLTLSCAPAVGLRQPNFIFGFVQNDGLPASAMVVKPSIGHGAAAHGVFVYALNAYPPGRVLRLDVGWAGSRVTPYQPGSSHEWGATTARKNWQFNRTDACDGQSVRPF